jgi:hypothetical protein
VKPRREPPEYKIKWGGDISKVEMPRMDIRAANGIMKTARTQWGTARALEHSTDLLKAAAAMDGRTKVNSVDYKLVEYLMHPLAFENIVLQKADFESSRTLDSGRLAVLTEFMSYGKFTVDQLAEDYHISASQAYKLMQGEVDDWRVVSKNPTVYAPSELLLDELKSIGFVSSNGTRPVL